MKYDDITHNCLYKFFHDVDSEIIWFRANREVERGLVTCLRVDNDNSLGFIPYKDCYNVFKVNTPTPKVKTIIK